MNTFTLYMPPAVHSGTDAMSRISEILCENKVNRVALFSDQSIERAGLLAIPLEQIRLSGAECVLLNDLPPEPSYTEAQRLVDRCKKANVDFIVAVGGGSVIDTAKLAGILMTDDYGVYELLDQPMLAKKCLKTLIVPTTAGTGAEATPNAIVAVPERALKIGIVNPAMIADYVVLDSSLIKNLPRHIAASTGIDALAHAIECYTGNKATPFSDLFAMEAMQLIFANIERACDDPDALDAKEAMLLASFYGGISISAAGTTAVHALSYPLGGKYHIPHGVSNAILLAPVMHFNRSHCAERLAQIYDRCMDGTAETVEEKSWAVIERLDVLVRHLNIPTSLQEFGVPASDLEGLVDAGMQVTRLLNNNIRPVTAEDARALYMQII